MEDNHTLQEVSDSANELISRVSQHPAIIRNNEITSKKPDPDRNSKIEIDEEMEGDILYNYIDKANRLVAEIDDSIKMIYKTVRNSYLQRFPELNVADPMQYLMTVQLLGNKPEKITEDDVKAQLSRILEPKLHLLVTMTAATTQGIKLEPDEMKSILKVCAVAIHLTDLRTRLLNFVELNMATIAPNLSVIVGAPIAAKLMGLAGGLAQLATMPSCNIPILGSHRGSAIETNINAPPRIGLIYECDLIQQIPFDHTKDVRKRAVRWVANKCVLAARCDSSHSDPNGNAGRMFRAKIEELINKELEPPPKKAARPLPAPIDKSGKKRGGKRVRRMKERYGQTELRKAANRINFGDVGDDAYQDDLGLGRSQLASFHGLRGPQVNDKTKIRLSKGAQKKLQAQAAKLHQMDPESRSKIEGTSSNGGGNSIIVTSQPQGLAIYNPKAAESYKEGTSGESSNYFSKAAGFMFVKKETDKNG